MQLQRQVGLAGAVLMGLGSIVGTGVYVSLGLAAGAGGRGLLIALVVAAVLAGFNGLSSAQLAANHPVSGGTYEYGYRLLGPSAGFTAGWMFLVAKSASAATAALGFAGHLLGVAGIASSWTVPVAIGAVATVTSLVYGGIRRSNVVNAVLVAVSLAALGLVVAFGAPDVVATVSRGVPPLDRGVPGVLEASALSFVAYTGYGRIATLGEEVVEPRRTIPRAVVAALVVVLALYLAVAAVGLAVLGADDYARITRETAAPLEAVAVALGHPWLAVVVAVGAVAAMLGVLLNLVLGLSRVLLAMGRRGDVPSVFSRVESSGTTPGPAVVAVGVAIAALVLVGDVKATWTFSALTVLVYYALTNASALRLPADQRLFPAWTAWAGLVGCASLAVWIDPWAWALGAALLAVGHGVRLASRP